MNKQVKIPSLDDYHSFDGGGGHKIWRETSDNWRCPVCNRTKFEILRWTKRQGPFRDGRRHPFLGWYACLHCHHDHKQNPWIDLGSGRFKKLVICDHCNSVDGAVKRKYDLPDNFSFSPDEIKQFITARPHEKHEIDYERALQIYNNRSLTKGCK